MAEQNELAQTIFNSRNIPEIQSKQVSFPNGFSLLIPNTYWELFRSKNVKFHEVRKTLEEEIPHIVANPFGEQSIDPSKDKPEAQRMRSVNTSPCLSKLFGLPIAIKGNGDLNPNDPWQENLKEQYMVLKYLKQQSAKNLTPKQRELIDFIDVYGSITYPVEEKKQYQEWLVMEQIPNAKRTGTYEVTLPKNTSKKHYCFHKEHHPHLTSFIRSILSPDELQDLEDDVYMRFEALRQALQKKGIPATNIVGRDLLYTLNEKGQRMYRIIDMKKEDLTEVPDFLK